MKELKLKFMKYVSLNVIGMIGLSCYILADTFFVAEALGTVGIAALNFSISIFSILQGIGLMIGIGGATDFSISKQEKSNSNNKSFTHAIVIGAVASFIFIIVAIFFTKQLGILLGADEATLPLIQVYLTTILSFSPFFILNNILLAFIRNDKNPKLSMIAMLVSSFSNIVLDYIFMFPLSMGIFGAALATGLSPIISLCILSSHFISKKQSFHLAKCKIHFSRVLRIISLGFSSFVGELASAIALITFNLIILKIEGNVGVAAYGIVANVALIATAIFVGISQGVQPLASKYYSKKDMISVNLILKYTIITSIIVSAAIYIVIYSNRNIIISMFNSENNKQLATLASVGIKIYFIGYIFAGINIISAAFFSATSKAKEAMIVSTLRSCVILIPIVLIFSMIFKMNGVWLSFVITELIVCIITVIFLYSLKDKNRMIQY